MAMNTANTAIDIHRWTRREFEQLVELGAFSDLRVELLEGYIVDMAPQSSLHVLAIRKTEEVLRGVFSSGYDVRSQMPLALDEFSEPEPDVAVVTGHMEDYRDAHPTSAVLIVEVSYSTLDKDRALKQALYARNRIPEYWIIDLEGDQLEVYRDPQRETYRSRQTLGRGEEIAPLAKPNYRIPVADLLP